MKNQHTLSIRLMPGGFSFSLQLKDSFEDVVPTFVNIAPGADYESCLENAILDLGVNGEDDDVQCYVETSRMSMSPAECDESLAEIMYRQTLRLVETEEKILHEMTQAGDMRVSFGISNDLYHFLVRTYQYIDFHHPIVEMIDADARRLHRTDNWMTARVNQGSLCLTAYQGKKLQTANCIETMVAQNRAYHVLNTWTMLNMDVLQDTLYIIGIEDEVEKLRSEVSNFIKLCE